MARRLPFFLRAITVTLLAVLSMGAVASAISQDKADAIRKKLQSARPDFTYGAIEASPMPGLYQVQIENGPLLYVSEDGGYLIDGTIYGVRSSGFVDLRELALLPIRQEKLAKLDTKDMIVFPAKGERKALVYVFTDVDCGYCRKLHQEVPAMNDMGIEVRYLAYPRAGLNSESYRKIAKAWCAKNPQEALTTLKNGGSVDAPVCDNNPVAAHFRLGNELGVTGTPAILLADGTLMPGYLPAKVLASRLGL